jgi:hypothetical protein
MKLSDFTHCIWQEGSIFVQSSCYEDKLGRLRAAYTAPKPFDDQTPDNRDALAEEHLRDLNETRRKGEAEFKLMTFDEVMPLIREVEDRELVTGWREISHETWRSSLNCLPPCRWRMVRGVELFYVSEAITSDIHSFYAAFDGRYFSRDCRVTVKYDDMAAGVYAFAKDNPTNQLADATR